MFQITLKTLANAVEDYTVNGFGRFEVEPITRDFAINGKLNKKKIFFNYFH